MAESGYLMGKTDLPADKMYALRHGITGKVWQVCEGFWLFKSVGSMERAWTAAKKCGLVLSEFRDHRVITIELVEAK